MDGSAGCVEKTSACTCQGHVDIAATAVVRAHRPRVEDPRCQEVPGRVVEGLRGQGARILTALQERDTGRGLHDAVEAAPIRPRTFPSPGTDAPVNQVRGKILPDERFEGAGPVAEVLATPRETLQDLGLR